MFTRTFQKLSRASGAASALNSGAAILAFAAVATLTAMLSTPAAAVGVFALHDVVDACARTPSCILTNDGGGHWTISSDHAIATCDSKKGQCTGVTFIAKFPKNGITRPTRPVVDGVSAGGNTGNNNPGGTAHPIPPLGGTSLKPVFHQPVAASSNPVSSRKPTGTIFIARAHH